MSDVQTRPAAARGRGSSGARGGRGGIARAGGRNTSRPAANTNGHSKPDSELNALPSLEEGGEIADLNKTHGPKLPILKEMFPDWSEVDLLYALKETDGDEVLTIERIAEGTISQWGEVSKQKKAPKSKSKDTFTTTTGADIPTSTNTRNPRGGRPDGTRGRGRATERGGRGAPRGRSVQPSTANGARLKENQPLSVPTDESTAWDTAKNADDGGWASAAAATQWESPAATTTDLASTTPSANTTTATATAAATATPAEPQKSTVIPQGTQKTWASMLRQSTAPKAAPQPPKEQSPPSVEPVLEPLPAAAEPPAPEPEPEPVAELSADPPQHEEPSMDNATVVVPEIALPPSKDQLTEINLEQVVDISNPPVTDTVASEAADSWDPRAAALSANATPISAAQAQHQPPKAPASGYAATAIKATERTPVPRTPSHQRRFLDQQEAVRMPVAASQLERTAVQFGAFNLNGSEDDIDGDREEPETRAQPPADSPVTQPRASLPPAPPAAVPDAFQKPASAATPPTGPTGISFATSQSGGHSSHHDLPTQRANAGPAAQAPPTGPAAQQTSIQAPVPQPPTQPAAQQQYGRFGQASAHQDQQPSFGPKGFESYNQQGNNPSSNPSQFEGFPGQQQQSQPQPQTQPQTQQPGAGYSSAADQYSSYYTADQQSRPPYNYYSQNYGQQAGQGQQDGGLGSSRGGFGGYGASQGDLANQYPQSANQSRFGATVSQDQHSGNTTPNPTTTQAQQPTGQTLPQAHGGQQQQQQQAQQHGSHYFNQPYYGQYYSNYMNQYNGYNQGGFGPYGSKGGLYGQPHQYGIAQQAPYDHTSSPATGYPQSSLHRGDSGVGSGLGDYGRAGSAQSGAQPGLGSGGFGGINDAFGRGATGYGVQGGQVFNAPSTQPGVAAAGNEDLKPFGDAKNAGGPSPSLGGAARPGSATNTAPSQTGLPPPQSAQQGMGYGGGYPSHLQGHGLHGTQTGTTAYGGMGAGSGQGHQNSPYSAYGGFGGTSYYGSQQPRQGGWGNHYGAGSGF